MSWHESLSAQALFWHECLSAKTTFWHECFSVVKCFALYFYAIDA